VSACPSASTGSRFNDSVVPGIQDQLLLLLPLSLSVFLLPFCHIQYPLQRHSSRNEKSSESLARVTLRRELYTRIIIEYARTRAYVRARARARDALACNNAVVRVVLIKTAYMARRPNNKGREDHAIELFVPFPIMHRRRFHGASICNPDVHRRAAISLDRAAG